MALWLLLTASALVAQTKSALQLDAGVDLKVHPVTKVVKLLTDMKNSLESEGKADAELYEKLQCWCTTNGGDKTKAIETAQRRIDGLLATIDELSAKAAELKQGIAQHNKEIAANTESLNQAAELRAKEHGEFSDDEAELTDSIRQVGGAVDSLEKHNSFLQVGGTSVKVLASVLARHQKAVSPDQRAQLESFLNAQALPSAGSYASRSGAIFGILSQMKETFENNLSQSQSEEAQAQREFDLMEATKQKEIKAGKAAVSAKTQALAETDEASVHAKHDLKKTRAALSADEKFLLDLQSRCASADAEYAERTKMRNEELAAVGDAVGILTDDEARDLFSSSLSFVQTNNVQVRAAKLLKAAGYKAKDMALVDLSSQVALDAFTKVKAAIEDMVGELQNQMEEEIEHQRFCTKELTANEKGQAEAKDNIKDLTASLADMAGTIDTLATDIAELQAEVVATNTAIKRASEDREAENAEFQQTVNDQRATQTILAKVIARLAEVYEKPALVQQEPGAAAPPMPEGFKEYKQQGSGGVLALIREIAAEANSLEKEALHAEQDAQSTYEAFIKDGAASVNAAQRAISAKTSEKASLETQSITAEGDKKANLNKLEHLTGVNGKLHLSCDYVLNNFKARQTARGEEIDALNSAKAILSGATFD